VGVQTEIIPGLNPRAIIFVYGLILEADIFLFGNQEVCIINVTH
jgi:hypothetical protein